MPPMVKRDSIGTLALSGQCGVFGTSRAIRAPGASARCVVIHASHNGSGPELTRPFVRRTDLTAGGTLLFSGE